ncbi:LacI family DNA-binding transcriptional regulator [Brooklawnia cerclae]
MMDVAAAAGVSHQTVSRVINETDRVAPETRERVLRAIAELGYRRNSVARALVTRKSGIVGVITTTSALYGPSSILLAVELAARRNAGYFTSVAPLEQFTPDAITNALDHFLGLAVEGVVIIAPLAEASDALASVHIPVPVVAVTSAEIGRASGVLAVSEDHFGGARQAVRHLIDLGHRDIVHVSGPKGWYEAAARRSAWRAEMEAAHLPLREIAADGWGAEQGFQAGLALAGGPVPTAVFAANDQLALGVVQAFDRSGLRVPDDVSVVGFDDELSAAFYRPPLTTVRQDFSKLGAYVIRTLMTAIEGEAPSEALVLPTRLVVRASTAPPRP